MLLSIADKYSIEAASEECAQGGSDHLVLCLSSAVNMDAYDVIFNQPVVIDNVSTEHVWIGKYCKCCSIEMICATQYLPIDILFDVIYYMLVCFSVGNVNILPVMKQLPTE